MGPVHFEYIRSLLKDRSGLVVTPEKMYLLETRLLPLARRHDCKTIEDLIDLHRIHGDEKVAVAMVEAMNTHESLFFRDNEPFELFRTHLVPELLRRRADKKTIRIWCAACSSGQEPYSLAMVLDDMRAQLQGWRAEIIATDISRAVLERAAQATFNQFEVQRGLAVQTLVKHFVRDGDMWQLSPRIRDMVQFQQFNLLNDPRGLGTFDVVLCRNVLIYFDLPTKTRVMDSIAGVLAKDGVLFLGSAESTIGITERFWPVNAGRGGVYKHTNSPMSIVERN